MTRKIRKIEKFVATAPGRHGLGQTSVVDPLGVQGDAFFWTRQEFCNNSPKIAQN